ncbi:MAG: TRAP transporter TatT component family protein [Gammaproteobacteria bacterium]|nr:TRAP transporter TatT component family protein [Gammaproteobacteria bacterium]NNF61765.1 hypothetical protein [Gammaproteobacteria bacterium]NNM20430.1 hypothetical protein [Gammaproteobacteria bacterium]
MKIARLLLLVMLPGLSGCGALVASAADRFAGNLTTAILEQDDPALVRDGLPAYLLLLDSLILSEPGSPKLLAAGAQMYASYAVTFATDQQRAQRLSERGRSYGQRALCLRHQQACDWQQSSFDDFVAALELVDEREAEALYAYTISWLAWLRANSGDWSALTDLPRVEAALDRLQQLDRPDQRANVNLYLGVLNTLRPPALGGDPEQGRAYFERAISLTGERDLSAKVEYARGYARLVYDRELHDRLLREVLEADPRAPALTLLNVLAQEQARDLLAGADDYF